MPARLKKSLDTSNVRTQEVDLPDLNPDSLLSLTEKIQNNLKKVPNVKTRKAPVIKTNNGRIRTPRSLEVVELPAKSAKLPTVVEGRSNGNAKSAGSKSVHVPKPQQGKKRLRDGNVKGLSNNRSDVNSVKLGAKANKASTESFNIEEEILALGGTMDDYELVAGALSESEIEGHEPDQMKVSRDSLQKDLAFLVKRLGVEKVQGKETEGYSDSEVDAESIDNSLVTTVHKVPPPVVQNGEKSTVQSTKPTGKSSPQLLFYPQSEWHAAALPETSQSPQNIALPQDLSKRIHQFAVSLLEDENTKYASRNGSASSAHHFYSTIMSSGTLSDKISALTLSVQESPVHNMKALESLVGLARKRSRGQAVEVLGALKDLFGPGALLPSDRKLRVFASQPALVEAFGEAKPNWKPDDPLPKPLREVYLILWAYEDWLKSTYFEILKIIETWCNDEVVFARVKAVDYVCQLLKEKPEQEANLLRLLVNKLGDSDKKIASRTSYSILQLQTTHPLMKPTIVASIESDLLFRPGQSLHAQYYAIITLNQTVLSKKEGDVARKLLDIYFSLFLKLLEHPKAAEPTSASSGANSVVINKKGEVQRGGSAPGKKAIKKQALLQKSANVGDDLREKMLSAVLTGVNRAIPFIATDDESFEKHLDTLFRVTHSSNFNTSIQALMLIQQLSGSHQGSADRFYRTLYESLLDPRLLTSSKQALYLNLLFRALRADLNVKRVKAFAKRLLQVVTMHQPAFACGSLYLLRELESVFANLHAFIDQAEEGDSDEEENFQDVQDDGSDPRAQAQEDTEMEKPARHAAKRAYDGRKRDPEHSNAEYSSLWELTMFLMHFHPSVALFASKLLSHEIMPPKPDLSSHTLIHFLDRFVYKNAKTTGGPRGNSIMQPMAGGDASGILVSARKNAGRDPVNSDSFWRMEGGKVDADEVFFHKYFSTMGKGKDRVKKKKAERKAGADDSSGAEEDEDKIWKALVDSRPELEGSDQSDGDMDGLESAMGDSDEEEEEAGSAAEAEDEENEGDAGLDVLDLGEEEGALLSSDDEAPSELDKMFKDEVQFGKEQLPSKADEEKRSKKRRRLKNLPTFASADDYAKMLDDDDEEDGLDR